LLIEVFDDEDLKKLITNGGFLLNFDYPIKNVKLHRITCRHCNPDNSVAVKPSSRRQNKSGEFWYSDNRQEAISKAIKISKRRGHRYSLCLRCKPLPNDELR
jgi:hypothetical protein